MQESQTFELLATVIQGGYCVGCGACASLPNRAFTMSQVNGTFEPLPILDCAREVTDSSSSVCPFSATSQDEDQLADEFLDGGTSQLVKHPEVGQLVAAFAGYVTEGDFRQNGSSGGFATWLGCELIDSGAIDSLIHVRQREPTPSDPRLYEYGLSHNVNDIRQHAKSQYHPVQISDVMEQVRTVPGRYAITAIPCVARAVRLLQLQDPVLRSRIVVVIGLVCGHMKSLAFAQFLGWQLGIAPSDLTAFSYRTKLPGLPANEYGVTASGRTSDDTLVTRIAAKDALYGTDWGLGLFKLQACDYCDDVFAETADVAVGDAWLPEYVEDPRGTNVIAVRSPWILELVEAAREAGRLVLDDLHPDTLAESQRSGLLHRRDGLAFRLSQQDSLGRWRPPKRVEANRWIRSRRFRRRMKLRSALAERSHEEFTRLCLEPDAEVSQFRSSLVSLEAAYRQTYSKGASVRIFQMARRITFSLLRKLPRKGQRV